MVPKVVSKVVPKVTSTVIPTVVPKWYLKWCPKWWLCSTKVVPKTCVCYNNVFGITTQILKLEQYMTPAKG